MSFCAKCGTKLHDAASFCIKCGAPSGRGTVDLSAAITEGLRTAGKEIEAGLKTAGEEIDRAFRELRDEFSERTGSFCAKCGTRNPQDAKFCFACGQEIGKTT